MKIALDMTDLSPLIVEVVTATYRQLESNRALLDERLGYTEPEAAALLGLRSHVLRDMRLRGEVPASRLGKRVVYARHDLMELLIRMRIE